MSSEQPTREPKMLVTYHECQCAICRMGLGDLLREFERGVAKTARASDRLRAQRKRHKKLREELQAKLDEAEANCRKAMEIVMHVASGRAGTFTMIHFDHEIYLKARALVQYTVPRETAPHGQATK